MEAFRDSCVLLRSQWEHFITLFEGTELKRELLQTTAPTFFGDLHRLLVEHLVLHICRLTDNAQTMGRKNLTVKFLIEHSDFSTAPDILEKLNRICADIDGFRDSPRSARICLRRDDRLGSGRDANPSASNKASTSGSSSASGAWHWRHAPLADDHRLRILPCRPRFSCRSALAT